MRATAIHDLADSPRRRARRRRRIAAARRARAAADVRPRRHRSGRHRDRHRCTASTCRPNSAARSRQVEQDAHQRRRARVQPRLAQAAAGDPVRRTRVAEDQADQDRLHHRRRRADRSVRQDRRSSCSGMLLRHREVARLKTVVDSLAADGRRPRPHPHHLQPDRRGDRAAVVGRSEPAEHPGAYRGGPPHPRGVRRRCRLRVADDRRLQPDRDAHHGAPVGRRGPDRGVHDRRGPAHVRRLACVRHPDRRGRPRAAPPDQGDVLRPGLRACRRSGCRSSSRSRPTRPAAQMDAYFARFGGVRDYLRSVVEDARQTGYTETIMGRRRYLAGPEQRQPATLREMAERMALNAPIQGSAADIIKVAMLGVHRGLADAGPQVPLAAAGARRTRPRDRRRRARARSKRWCATRWATPTSSATSRWTCRSESAGRGTRPRTDLRPWYRPPVFPAGARFEWG